MPLFVCGRFGYCGCIVLAATPLSSWPLARFVIIAGSNEFHAMSLDSKLRGTVRESNRSRKGNVRKKISLLFLDISSAVLLGLGVAILLLPFVLYLGLGADNDAYIEIAEWGGGKVNIFAHLDMVWMFQIDYLLLPAVPIITGL